MKRFFSGKMVSLHLCTDLCQSFLVFISLSVSFVFPIGYKPSHAEKMNDRYMKNAVAEIHKLRKEKQQIKSNSVSGSGLKVTQTNNGKKSDKLKDVLVEIEKVSGHSNCIFRSDIKTDRKPAG